MVYEVPLHPGQVDPLGRTTDVEAEIMWARGPHKVTAAAFGIARSLGTYIMFFVCLADSSGFNFCTASLSSFPSSVPDATTSNENGV